MDHRKSYMLDEMQQRELCQCDIHVWILAPNEICVVTVFDETKCIYEQLRQYGGESSNYNRYFYVSCIYVSCNCNISQCQESLVTAATKCSE